MRMPDANAAPRTTFVEKWLAQEPEARLIRVFCAAARAPGADELSALEHEWHDAVFGVSDARVSVSKLAWWDAELERWSRGAAQHPLARALHDQCGVDVAVPLRASVRAAATLAECDSIDSGERLLDAFADMARGFMRARGQRDFDASARIWGAARLVHSLRHWSRWTRPERAWVPLSILARAGCSRRQLHEPAHARAVRDALLDLASAPLNAAWTSGDLLGAQALTASMLSARLRRSAPGPWVQLPGWRLTWALWRAARRAVG